MKRFVQGMDRVQSTLLPECLDDWIGEDNPVPAAITLLAAHLYTRPPIRREPLALSYLGRGH